MRVQGVGFVVACCRCEGECLLDQRRPVLRGTVGKLTEALRLADGCRSQTGVRGKRSGSMPVSYTHLTLPTIYSV